jgi:NitT/TauT family transport system permease protein
MNRRLWVGLRQAAGLAAVVALWQWAADAGHLNPLYMPAPSAVAATLVQLFVQGTIWPHLWATFSAALGGLVIGLAIGTVLGAAAALTPFLGELLEPVMIGLNAVPRVVLAPLFVIWFGIGLGSKVALAVILVAVLVFFTVFTGIRSVDQKLVERVVTLGGRWRDLLREVYLPSVTAWVLGNLKVAVGFAFTGAVVGEFVAATRGLGYLLSFAQSSYNSALMLALVALIMGFVLLIFAFTGWLERRLLRWRG